MNHLRKGIVLVFLVILLFLVTSGRSAAVDRLLSQGKPATASSFQVGNEVAKGNDGNLTTRWTAVDAAFPQWWKVDLGASYSINKVDISWYSSANRAYKYKIEVSSDNASFATVIDKTGNVTFGDTSDSFTVTGRYVRITVTGSTAGWASAYEFKVYNSSGTVTVTPTKTPISTPTATPTAGPTPISSKVLPGKIEAESYNSMSGVQTETTGDTGGGLNVGWIELNDWMDYNVTVNSASSYRIDYRVASPNTTGKVDFRVNGVTLASTTIPNTGGWQAWTTVSTNVSLNAGAQTVRLFASGGGFNINWFSGTGGGPTPTQGPTSTPTPTPTQGPTPTGPQPTINWGPNVHIFDSSMSTTSIQSVITEVYNAQQNNQFGDRRDALLFKPGTYNVDVGVGFYTEVLGLGANPDAVNITGNLHSDAYLGNNNATCNFWRGASNLSVTPSNGTVKWAVSQAIWFRQNHVKGSMVLHQNGGWASGGWMANTKVDGSVGSGSQQQWISRNTQWGSWSGSNWDMVFVGCVNAPANSFPNPPYTTIAQTPIVREKPFLQIDSAGNYSVRVPSFKTNSSGFDWAGGSVPGTTIPINQFYVAHAGDSAATINAKLAAGQNLILTPGIYTLNDTIRITRPNTIVLGMGLATIRPTTGLASMTIADVDGVIIAGVLFDAGTTNSPVQLEVGTNGNTTSHAANPIVLQDVIFRVGGAAAGKTNVSMIINANDTIVDHTWVWRADHGSGVGWTSNTAANGVIVNGNNVTCYGLFVEHYQQYQTLWNGNNGRVYFYQSEDPYDPPNQTSWTSGSGVNGWASYKVSNNVINHEAWGLGVYSVFSNAGVNQTRAIEVPVTTNVKFHSMVIKDLSNGHIQYVINNTVGPTVTNFP